MRGATRAPQASVDQRQTCNGERNQQNKKETKQGGVLRQARAHSLSSLAGKCVLATRPSPRSSVIAPATTNAESALPCKSASALITIPHPDSSNRNPPIFICLLKLGTIRSKAEPRRELGNIIDGCS